LVRKIDDSPVKKIFRFQPTLKLRIASLFLCILSAVAGSAQDVWHSVPTPALGPNDPDLAGASVDAVAIRRKKKSKARVVISGPRKLGTAVIGIWIDRLNEVISEDDLWPYTGPPLGREALNPHMIEITIVSPKGKVQFDSQMIMLSGGSFPKGTGGDEYFFATNCKTDKRFKAFIDQMNMGFDYGFVVIGRGVFSPPIEVKFGGEGIKGILMPAMVWTKAKADNVRANTSTK
jgi:hypothetical protein